jgi:large subunit ribosomal protein L24
MVKKAVRPSRRNQKGGIIEVEAAIDLSNVMIICKKCGPTRIGFQGSGREKLRVCRKCGENL